MAVISVIRNNGKNITKARNSTISNVKVNGVNCHFAKSNEVTDGICLDAVNEPIIDMQLSGNSVQDGTPTPETPVDIESVGDKTSNLLEYPYYQKSNETSNGITWELNSDRSITVSGTSSDYSSIYLSRNQLNLEDGKTYYFKAKGSLINASLIFAYYDENGTRQYNGNGKVWSSNYTNPQFYVQVTPNKTASGTFFPYIVAEDKSLDYEPYGYKVPIKVSGSNIADLSKANTSTTTSYVRFNYDNLTGTVEYTSQPTGYDYLMIYLERDVGFKFEQGKTYYWGADVTISGKTTTDKKTTIYFGITYDNSSTTGKVHHIYENGSFYISGSFVYEGQTNIRLTLHANYGSDEPAWVKYENIFVSEVNEFEPYIEPTTTNIYLNEPLRSITYKNEVYADIIDYKNKKVIRNICSEYITSVYNKSSTVGTYGIFLSEISNKPKMYNGYAGLCIASKFVMHTVNGFIGSYVDLTEHGGHIQTYITTGGLNRVAYSFNDSSITTVAQAQEKIGNGFEVYYVPATPTEETIELPTIETFDGTTMFDTDTNIKPSEIQINYWKQI